MLLSHGNPVISSSATRLSQNPGIRGFPPSNCSEFGFFALFLFDYLNSKMSAKLNSVKFFLKKTHLLMNSFIVKKYNRY
jgi:hypothetical protein